MVHWLMSIAKYYGDLLDLSKYFKKDDEDDDN